MNQLSPPQTRGTRLGLIVGGILVVAVVAAAIVNSVRPVQQLDPNTPEGVVQSFLVAIADDQFERAYRLLSAAAQAECEASDLAIEGPELSRIVVADVSEFDSETLVILEGTVLEADPIDPYTYQTTLEFTLIQEGGALKIDRLPYPYSCRTR